jgi:predicted DNA-binding ribbon-helix-helix protein
MNKANLTTLPRSHKETFDCLRREKRNVYVGTKRTTIAVEGYVWSALEKIASEEGRTIDEICSDINSRYSGSESLSTAIRFLSHEVVRLKGKETGFAANDYEMQEQTSSFPSPYHRALSSLNSF